MDIRDFKTFSEKIGHEILALKWLLAPNALMFAADEVTEILLSDEDQLIKKEIQEEIQKLRDIELDRRMSSLDAGQLLIVAQLIASANAASKKLKKKGQKRVKNEIS